MDSADGIEWVNAGQPTLEGKSLLDLKDVNGKRVMKEYLDAALAQRKAWVDYAWYKPGSNTPTGKHTYVRKAVFKDKTYVLGAGFYD